MEHGILASTVKQPHHVEGVALPCLICRRGLRLFRNSLNAAELTYGLCFAPSGFRLSPLQCKRLPLLGASNDQ